MIPPERELRRALLMELYACDNYAMIPKDSYELLLDYMFSSQPDKSEIRDQYYNSKSQWGNAIQVARNRLIEEGHILTPKENKRNEWKLSTTGIELGKKLFIEAYGYDPHK